MVHEIAVIPTNMPGCFQILCRCGETEKTFWGEDHAVEIGELHLWEMAGKGARFLPDGTDPARNLLNPRAIRQSHSRDRVKHR